MGIKIVATGLEKAVAGTGLMVVGEGQTWWAWRGLGGGADGGSGPGVVRVVQGRTTMRRTSRRR
jgi:hypothetical protein